jgi:tetratricopeptide (TPR) repeat protein
MAPFSDAYSEAKAAALRALAMDTSCAAAQTALGAVLFFSEWDWLAAERSLRRALDLDPGQTEAYLLYGQLLEALGKLESGLAMKRKALQLEPLSPLVHFALSLSYWNQRLYDESIGWANKTLELDPSHPHTREFLAGAYLKKGDFDRWLAENLAHAQSHGVPAAALDPLKNAYAKGGPAGVAKLIVERGSSQPQAFPPMQLAIQYAELGNLDSAFQHLERAIDSRDPGLVYLAVAPQWDSLRADTRFLHCLGRMGLSPVRQS